LEIPASTTLEGCWALVRESERSRRHCILLENVCYGQEELMVLNMVRAGLLGQVVHVEGAYIHDLRAQLAELPPNEGRGAWRRRAHRERIGDLYPTHGLGPLSSYLGINRGDRIESIVSVSSREVGLSSFISNNAQPTAAMRAEKFICGDVTTSMLGTHSGVSIMLQHCVVGPRPYSRHNLVQGTRGAFIGFPARYYLDDPSRLTHPAWRDAMELAPQYEHPLWSKEGDTARALGGHGGMDYIMMFRLIDAMTAGRPPDIDVYDAAVWSAVSPLSAESIRQGASVGIPDFTNGAWSRKRAGFLA
jgi:predicted dehydrogenase